MSDEVVVTIEDPKGEPVEICEDNPFLANCELVVGANWCFVGQYTEICCKSCREAGATPPTTTPTPPEAESTIIDQPEESTETLTEETQDLEPEESLNESDEQIIDNAVDESEVSDDANESEILELTEEEEN